MMAGCSGEHVAEDLGDAGPIDAPAHDAAVDDPDQGLGGTGAPNSLARWTSDSTLTTSSILDDGARISILDDTTQISTTHEGSASHGKIVMPSNVQARAPFAFDTGVNTFNVTEDPTLAIGYNTTHRGGKVQSGEHSLGWYIEADYNDGVDRLMEIYTQYISDDLSTQIRPLFFQFNRETRRLSNSVILGNPLNVLDDQGNKALELSPTMALFSSPYLLSTSFNWTLTTSAPGGNVYLRSNGGAVYINSSQNSGDVSIAEGNGTTTIHGRTLLGDSGDTTQVNNDLRVTDGASYLRLVASGGINYLQSGAMSQPGSTAELRITNFGASDVWARFDSTGNFVSYKHMKLGDNGPSWSTGVGSPEGIVEAPVGSLYTRSDGGPGTTLYVKESGTGTTGWTAK
jgi:hypothetical protein